MKIEPADRLNLPPYLFAEIDRMKEEVKAKGVDILDFGVGDPDLPTPMFIVEALRAGLRQKNYHQYSSYSGTTALKEAVARWFLKRYSVELDPKREVLILIGSKEGIAHMPLAMVNPGDGVLYTTPGYPVYKIATEFAGGTPIPVTLRIDNNFLPEISGLNENAKLFFLNYPNNPTSATAPLSYFEELVHWARRSETILCHDAAYTELYLGDEPSKSILQVPGAKEVTIEFHSLSKTFNMTGWRVGFAVGNEKLISALGKMKTNIDSGQFLPIQHAATVALEKGDEFVRKQRRIYRRRRDQMVGILNRVGLESFPCNATFYLWTKSPKNYKSIDFCNHLLKELGIVSTPGVGFGEGGEGFFRFSLTVPDDHFPEAARRFQLLSL